MFRGFCVYLGMEKKISTREFDRMEGLVLINSSEQFDNAIRSFIIDLVEEGYTVDDVKKFIQEKQERVYFEFRGYDNEEK